MSHPAVILGGVFLPLWVGATEKSKSFFAVAALLLVRLLLESPLAVLPELLALMLLWRSRSDWRGPVAMLVGCDLLLLCTGVTGGYLQVLSIALAAATVIALRYRKTGYGLLVLGTFLGCGLWLYIGHQESKARLFQTTGFAINDACTAFSKDFLKNDREAMATFVGKTLVSLDRVPVEQAHPFQLWRWTGEGDSDFYQWRDSLPKLEQAAFKIHLLDQVDKDRVVAQIRFELNSPHRSDYGLMRCRFERAGENWSLVASELLEGTSTQGQARFEIRELDFFMEPDDRLIPPRICKGHDCPGAPRKLKFEMMRHAYGGAATADYNGDGHDDVFLGAGGRSVLLRNRGDGTFEEATNTGLPELWHVNTAGFADLDNDGDQDLLVCRYFGPNEVFENLGEGKFRSGPELPRVDFVTCFAFFDYDGDGDLDFYLGRYLDPEVDIPESFLYTRNGQPDQLYQNQGGLRFREVSAEAGVGDHGLALSLAAADYDQDGDQDLYVANDFGRNVLYQNQGDGTFQEVTRATRSSAIGGSMSVSWGDYNEDGRLDLYISAIRSNQRWFVQPLTVRKILWKFIKEGKMGWDNPLLADLKEHMGSEWTNIGNVALGGNSLLEQLEDGTFVERGGESRTRPAGWYWSAGFLDLDNDTDLDVFALNGWITGKDSHDL